MSLGNQKQRHIMKRIYEFGSFVYENSTQSMYYCTYIKLGESQETDKKRIVTIEATAAGDNLILSSKISGSFTYHEATHKPLLLDPPCTINAHFLQTQHLQFVTQDFCHHHRGFLFSFSFFLPNFIKLPPEPQKTLYNCFNSWFSVRKSVKCLFNKVRWSEANS